MASTTHNPRSRAPITIGRVVRQVIEVGPLHLLCRDEQLEPHVGRPWFLKVLHDCAGMALAPARQHTAGDALLPHEAIARHLLCTGPPGTGKTRTLELVACLLLRAGYSLVVCDIKPSTIRRLLAHCHRLGIPPEQVRLLDPSCGGWIPGLNPLLAGSLKHMVSDLVSLITAGLPGALPRMEDVLANALFLAGSLQLSIAELVRMLTLPGHYLARLLARPVRGELSTAVKEARYFFEREFFTWPRTERASAVGPVVRRLREFLRNEFLCPLLTARRNTIDFARPYREQTVLLCCADPALLGDAGAKLLSGLILSGCFRAAMRESGPVPVALMLDELSMTERMAGRLICDILALARSQGLHLMLACQHLDQCSPELRASLLTNPAIKLAFRQVVDARLLAATLAAGFEPTITRLSVEVDRLRGAGDDGMARVSHRIRDVAGRPLRIDVASWQEIRRGSGAAQLHALLLRCAAAGHPRLYVRSADTGAPVEIRRYVDGVPPTDFAITGPVLRLVITLPRPKLSDVQHISQADALRRYTKSLLELPNQEAILSIMGMESGVVRIADMPDPEETLASDAYVAAVRRAGGQSPAEIADTQRFREGYLQALATESAVRLQADVEDEDDGSIR